jgi:dephospho-CoA kinase
MIGNDPHSIRENPSNPCSPVSSGKPVLGLIGGIGSGKSRVAEEFARHGARIIGADAFGHEALRQPDILAQVARRWGPAVLDERGQVSRRAVAGIVFADAGELRALEALVFPWIGRRIEEEIAAAQADPGVSLVVLDAAIMVETGWHERCDQLVYVHAPRAERLRRLALQRNWSAKEVADRARAQLPLTEKVRRADFVVDNSGPPAYMTQQVHNLLCRLLSSPP